MENTAMINVNNLKMSQFMIDSSLDNTTHYLIHQDKEGISIISGDQYLTIHKSLFKEFVDELIETWKLYGT
jgi:hypothetical protein